MPICHQTCRTLDLLLIPLHGAPPLVHGHLPPVILLVPRISHRRRFVCAVTVQLSYPWIFTARPRHYSLWRLGWRPVGLQRDLQRWDHWSLCKFPDAFREWGTEAICVQYTDNVIGPGSPRYDNAYFQINYVRVYVADNITSSVSSSLHATSTAISSSKPTSTGSKSGANASVVLGVSSFFHLFILLCLGALVVLI